MNVPPLFDPSGGVQGTFKQFKLALEEIKANIFQQIGFTQIFILSDANRFTLEQHRTQAISNGFTENISSLNGFEATIEHSNGFGENHKH